jgi:hypothetical protein
MQFHSPSRPRLRGIPQVLWNDEPVGALGGLSFFPLPDGTIQAATWLIGHTHNDYAQLKTVLNSPSEFEQLFLSYLEDPEQVLRTKFGWVWKPRAASVWDEPTRAKSLAKVKPEASLGQGLVSKKTAADLGL